MSERPARAEREARRLARQRARERVEEVRELFEHLAAYVCVNTGLFVVDLLTGPSWWFYWPLLGWGVGLGIHAVTVFTRGHFTRYAQRIAQFEEDHAFEAERAPAGREGAFAAKLKDAIGAETMKSVGQEIAQAMRKLEDELGDMGLDWGGSMTPSRQAAPALPQGVAILMFTDLEGFTSYTERHGDEAGATLLKLHHRVVRDSVKAHDGVEIKSLGDGFMLCFASARKALLCAAEVQAKLKEDGFPLAVRIGLHAGEPIRDGADLTGQTVNVASRVMDQANGGQVLVTELVKHLAGPLKGFQYVDQGMRRLPGLSERQSLWGFVPIEALNSPLDSEVDRKLEGLERDLP